MPTPGGPVRIRVAAITRPLATAFVVVALIEVLKRAALLPVFLPAPSQVVHEIIASPRLVTGNLGPTAFKAFVGYLIAMGVTLTAGSLAVLVRALYAPIYNFSVILNSIPIIATAPLLALSLGTGPQVQIIIAALACQFPMLVGTVQGLKAVDKSQRELMHVLSASPWQTLRYLLIPSAIPYLFAGFKISAPSAVLGAVTAEWAGAERGLGAMMLYALFSYDTTKVWLSVALTCLLAAGGYGIVVAIEGALLRVGRQIELVG